MPYETIVLSDEQTGSRASVLVGLGFNCYRFEPVIDGKRYQALWSHEGFEQGNTRPSGSGIPLLFPFPGRIGGASFEYEGETYRLPEGDGLGNAIHGFVFNRQWRIVERHGARLVGRFQFSRDDPAMLHYWPTDACVTAAYELRGNTLSLEIEISNPDDHPLPFGFGIHPYFRVPFAAESQASDMSVSVPAGSYFPLENMVPTGEEHAVDAARDLREARPFEDITLDDVLADLKFDEQRGRASLFDEREERKLELTYDQSQRCCVVFTPPHREAICIEPYTCLPDSFRLRAAGLGTGLRELPPGERFTTRYEMSVV